MSYIRRSSSTSSTGCGACSRAYAAPDPQRLRRAGGRGPDRDAAAARDARRFRPRCPRCRTTARRSRTPRSGPRLASPSLARMASRRVSTSPGWLHAVICRSRPRALGMSCIAAGPGRRPRAARVRALPPRKHRLDRRGRQQEPASAHVIAEHRSSGTPHLKHAASRRAPPMRPPSDFRRRRRPASVPPSPMYSRAAHWNSAPKQDAHRRQREHHRQHLLAETEGRRPGRRRAGRVPPARRRRCPGARFRKHASSAPTATRERRRGHRPANAPSAVARSQTPSASR